MSRQHKVHAQSLCALSNMEELTSIVRCSPTAQPVHPDPRAENMSKLALSCQGSMHRVSIYCVP